MIALITRTQANTWLSQFEPADRITAQALLDALHLISASEFSEAMAGLLTDLVESRPNEEFAFYPARELGTGEAYFPDKGRKPIAVLKGSVGSEGHVAAMLTKFCAGVLRAREWPPLSTLKRYRVSNLVVVDDMAISGNRAASFARKALMDVPRIRSSCSLGLTRMHLVAHTITREAEERFCREVQKWSRMREDGRVEVHRADRQGLRSLSHVPGISELVAKYPRSLPGRLAGYRHGYAGSMSSVVFQHGCPNNVPALCWAKISDWHPLFPKRAVSAAMQRAFSMPLTGTVSTRPSQVTVLAVLETQKRRRFTEAELRQATGLSTLTIRRACAWAKNLSLLDADGRLSASGRREIKRIRRGLAAAQVVEDAVAVAYHPTQLRASKVRV